MTTQSTANVFPGLPVDQIRNRTEKRVLSCMQKVLTDADRATLTDKDICDIYALALNSLPSRYTQPGTIVLGRIPEEAVEEAVRSAWDNVVKHPKR